MIITGLTAIIAGYEAWRARRTRRFVVSYGIDGLLRSTAMAIELQIGLVVLAALCLFVPGLLVLGLEYEWLGPPPPTWLIHVNRSLFITAALLLLAMTVTGVWLRRQVVEEAVK